jgi:hypothetical protein
MFKDSCQGCNPAGRETIDANTIRVFVANFVNVNTVLIFSFITVINIEEKTAWAGTVDMTIAGAA